jgi:NADH-quinone oxidoreductase subunit F
LIQEPYATLDEYLRRRGGSAVVRARAMRPQEIVVEIERSGLRGRGGAGFPTGAKWRTTMRHECSTRYAVCNGAEGEPGTFKDRYLLRRDPYSMLEGLLIAAHVIGAEELYVAMKASFTRELARVRAAIEEMREAGLLEGVTLHVIEGPEEYLFGEEKALLEVVEGNDPLPREPHYPPYERGLFATPTSPNPAVVNNVETYARVAGIVRAGAASFRKLGTEDTPGPLLFTVSGDVVRPGVYELEAGITLRELVHDIAGGPRPGRAVKALLCGVSAAVIPADRLDTPADHAHLQLIGSGLGSAGFIVLDDQASMARVTQAVARFLYVESCNQCPACKHGLRTASTALDELFNPRTATPDDAERALYGARQAPQGNRCYLPVQGAILIPSLLRTFSGELDAQLKHPSGASRSYILPKIVDFDEASRTFIYDELQPRKRPNWTYDDAPIEPTQPVPMSVPKPIKPARPAAETAPLRTATVRLAPDVREALARVLRDESEVDTVVNAALREWLQDHGA